MLKIFQFTLAYVVVFWLVALGLRYQVWLDLPPVSIHQWRQADGVSIASHYALNPTFSEVLINNLGTHGDAHAVGELPLLYWLSGLMTRYWGFPAYPLRWIGLLLLCFGFWCFGWIVVQVTKRPMIGVLAAHLVLTSPILTYYGWSSLPDAPAFCGLLMMSAGLWRAHQRQCKYWLFVAALAAILAITLKISTAIFPIALIGTWWMIRRSEAIKGTRLWDSYWPLAAISLVGMAVVGFYHWVSGYNMVHQSTYFLSTTRPIWNYRLDYIWATLVIIARSGLPAYASIGLYIACLGCCYLTIKYWKNTPLFHRNTLIFLLVGGFCYVLLWFRMLREHDYYVICLMVIPAVLLVNGLSIAVRLFNEQKMVLALLGCFSLGIGHNYYALSKRMDMAFYPNTLENLPPSAFLSPRELTDAGIPLSARILCPQDPSPNIALVALGRYGWSGYNFGNRITADTLLKYQSNFTLTHLALRDTTGYRSLYQPFFPHPKWQGQGWIIYEK